MHRARGAVARPGVIVAVSAAVPIVVAAILFPARVAVLPLWTPTVDGITVSLYVGAAALASVDSLVRREGRALPIASVAVACTVLWILHLLTSPDLVPGLDPRFGMQKAALAFQVAHIGTPLALGCGLVLRCGALRRPRLALLTTVGGAVAAAVAVVLPVLLLADRLPATATQGGSTAFSTGLDWVALVPVTVALGLFAAGFRADHRTVTGTAAALVFIAGEAVLRAVLQPDRFTVAWYGLEAMRILPALALATGQLTLHWRSVVTEATQIAHLSLLNEAGAELARLRGVGEVRAAVVRHAVRVRGARGELPARAVLLEAQGSAVTLVAEADGDQVTTKRIALRMQDLAWQAIEDGDSRARAVSDLDERPRRHLEAMGVTHVAWVPIRTGTDGGMLLSVSLRDGIALTPAELDTLRGLAHIANLAMVNAESFARLRDIAATDTLTGLPNRREFDRIVNQPRSRPYAIMAIDVDNLKQLNDTEGHEAGDAALREIGAAFSASLRGGDIVARTGGDEFTGFIPGADLDTAYEVAERLRSAVHGLAVRGGLTRVSIGVAAGRADDEPHDVWAVADGALMTAKRGGRDRTEAVGPDAGHPFRSRLARWETLLPELIEERGITAVFQPIVDLSTGVVTAYEALARPVGHGASEGVDSLFSAAQRLGVMRDLDWMCRRAAVQDAAGLPAGRALFVNVGVSALLDPLHDVDQMLLLLRWARREPSEVVLEITEREAVRDMRRLEEVIGHYRDHGFRFALDDVGEGHSTFEVLAAAIPEFVKVSQTLVRRAGDPGPRAAIKALVAFAVASGAEVVAEGLEEEADHERMSALGATLGQGWLLGRPAPAATWMAADAHTDARSRRAN